MTDRLAEAINAALADLGRKNRTAGPEEWTDDELCRHRDHVYTNGCPICLWEAAREGSE